MMFKASSVIFGWRYARYLERSQKQGAAELDDEKLNALLIGFKKAIRIFNGQVIIGGILGVGR